MAYRLQICDPKLGINLNARYQNLAKGKRPAVEAKAINGNIVKERSVYQGTVLVPGSTTRQWVDDKGTIYNKSDLKFYYEGEVVEEIAQTKVFTIQGYQPLENYTDNYVIDKYYEIYPDDNGMKKDFDRERARDANRFQMRKLWDHLITTNQVARAEFCTSSRGFLASDGYIRAIKINSNKWGLEIGLFKEEKIFEHLQEGVPSETALPTKSTGKKLKMV